MTDQTALSIDLTDEIFAKINKATFDCRNLEEYNLTALQIGVAKVLELNQVQNIELDTVYQIAMQAGYGKIVVNKKFNIYVIPDGFMYKQISIRDCKESLNLSVNCIFVVANYDKMMITLTSFLPADDEESTDFERFFEMIKS
jgi:hypothetical protein